MDSPEFDHTKPLAGQAAYRVQRVDCSWSEWRPINQPIAEAHILSMQISEWVTPEQYREFTAQIEVG